jgi:hypothetical protein
LKRERKEGRKEGRKERGKEGRKETDQVSTLVGVCNFAGASIAPFSGKERIRG